ncbi:MAG: helix-turn-helix domain-containing protein [Defluviitaleaceae bacterium]|nr:helix-turn-helix domain-containing protein [Defluviitaleaceae bacterium]
MYDKELAEIGKRIETLRKGKGWTQEILADKLNIARNTLTKLEGGFRDFKSTELLNIAKVLDVSTDYLLGLTEMSRADATARDVSERYGLFETPLNELSNMPTSEKPFGAEHAQAMSRQAETMAYRAIFNLLLSSEHGKKALKLLTSYYFANLDDRSKESIPAFILPWDLPDGGTWLDTAMVADDLQREVLLILANDELRALRLELAGIDTTYPQKYSYAKPPSTETVIKAQAAYDARNPHIKKGGADDGKENK